MILYWLINKLCNLAHYRVQASWVTKDNNWDDPNNVFLVKTYVMIEDKNREYMIYTVNDDKLPNILEIK